MIAQIQGASMKSKKEGRLSEHLPIYVKFKSLPNEIQKRLLKRQSGAGEGFVFQTGSIISELISIIIALLWFGLLLYLANDYVWGNAKLIIFGILTLGAAILFIYNADKPARWLTSRSKCCLLVTPLYVIDINFNDVRYWNLDQIISATNTTRQSNGENQPPQITLRLENESRNLRVKDRAAAEETIEQIIYYRKLFIEAMVRNDQKYLNSNDDLIELKGSTNKSDDAWRSVNFQRIVTFSAAAIATVGIMLGIVLLNNFYDDKKSWTAAQSLNNAASFRKYLLLHPAGRSAVDANEQLLALYDSAEQHYRSSLNKGFEENAVNAVLEVLKYAKQTQNYRVGVTFERHNEIPANIEDKLKKELEIKNVLPLGDALSDERMIQRENGLLSVVAQGFRQAIPEDVLELTNECAGECVNFMVKYTVNVKDTIYYDNRQEKFSDDEKVYYPGIFIIWDFNVQIPNNMQNYNFKLVSLPAQEIYYDSNASETIDPKKDFENVLNADKGLIYDSMVESAFDDFKAVLNSRMGIGAPPKNKDNNNLTSEEVPANPKENSRASK